MLDTEFRGLYEPSPAVAAALAAPIPLMCEQHSCDWPHDDCSGPGTDWVIRGRDRILGLQGKA